MFYMLPGVSLLYHGNNLVTFQQEQSAATIFIAESCAPLVKMPYTTQSKYTRWERFPLSLVGFLETRRFRLSF